MIFSGKTLHATIYMLLIRRSIILVNVTLYVSSWLALSNQMITVTFLPNNYIMVSDYTVCDQILDFV